MHSIDKRLTALEQATPSEDGEWNAERLTAWAKWLNGLPDDHPEKMGIVTQVEAELAEWDAQRTT